MDLHDVEYVWKECKYRWQDMYLRQTSEVKKVLLKLTYPIYRLLNALIIAVMIVVEFWIVVFIIFGLVTLVASPLLVSVWLLSD